MDQLRQYAKEARKRLRGGFWENAIEERRAVIDDAVKNGQDLNSVKAYCRRKIEGQIRQMSKVNNLSDDDKMYQKVCSMMESDEVLLNPLSLLIDHEVYDELSPNAKQVYILKLSEKYVEMKRRYNIEHNIKADIAFN